MNKHRAFLKWAGGKYRLIDRIQTYLPEGDELIEPFVGAGSVFLNSNYGRYLLADINTDLISVFNLLKSAPDSFIQDLKTLFIERNNQSDAFYQIRDQFNNSADVYQRSILFVYLNRHGYNGLCRYNSQGKFNVPFGQHKKIYFPEKELYHFAEKAQLAEFICAPYQDVMNKAQSGSIIYCDPPYLSINQSQSFTAYYSNAFGIKEHKNLSNLAAKLSYKKKVPVLISNHDTPHTRELYKKARHLYTTQLMRTISCNGKGRQKIDEIFALYL